MDPARTVPGREESDETVELVEAALRSVIRDEVLEAMLYNEGLEGSDLVEREAQDIEGEEVRLSL